MAASTFVPAPRSQQLQRSVSSASAARIAPRGVGLAPVIPLPSRVPPSRPAPGRTLTTGALRLVPTARAVHLRRRIAVATAAAAVVAAAVLSVTALVGSVVAGPSASEVIGHVVLQPGDTLWDVAVRSAPAGVDPRRQLDDIRRLNAFGSGPQDAWTVVLIPAP